MAAGAVSVTEPKMSPMGDTLDPAQNSAQGQSIAKKTCEVCKSDLVRPIWLGWWRCEICGSDTAPHGYDRTLYDASFAEKLSYHRDHGVLDFDGQRREMTVNVEWIKRLPLPELSILDAGCCWGVSRACFPGWRWHGWDVAEYADQDEAVIVAEEPPQIAPVGVVMLREVIEHPADPVTLLRQLHALTLPGGWIQVQTPRPMPNIDVLYDPQHLRLYSPEALGGVLWDCGWSVRERLEWDRGQCVAARRIG